MAKDSPTYAKAKFQITDEYIEDKAGQPVLVINNTYRSAKPKKTIQQSTGKNVLFETLPRDKSLGKLAQRSISRKASIKNLE